MKHYIKSKLTRFLQDTNGLATIEFAFTVPFLLLLWLGAVSVIDMENSSTEVGKVTSTVADILAQAPEVTEETVDNAFLASQALLGHARKADFEIYVAGIRITKIDPLDDDEVGTATVVWSRGSNLSTLSAPAPGTTFALDTSLKKRVGFIVATHGKLKHVPIYADQYAAFGETDHTVYYEYKNFFTPRNSVETVCIDCPTAD